MGGGVTSLGIGHVTDCPAYLSVTVNDRTAAEELCRYDALVSCPPQFNITINVPPPPPSSASGDDRVFEVVLHDSKIEQRVFMSTFVVRDVEDGQLSDALPGRPADDGVKYGGKTVIVVVVVVVIIIIIIITFVYQK